MSEGIEEMLDAGLSDEALARTLEACIHMYSARIQEIVDEGGELFAPLSANGVATATDVMITTRNILKVFEIAPFELGMLTHGGIR